VIIKKTDLFYPTPLIQPPKQDIKQNLKCQVEITFVLQKAQYLNYNASFFRIKCPNSFAPTDESLKMYGSIPV